MSGLFIFFYFSARKWNCFFGTFYFSAEKGKSFYGRPLTGRGRPWITGTGVCSNSIESATPTNRKLCWLDSWALWVLMFAFAGAVLKATSPSHYHSLWQAAGSASYKWRFDEICDVIYWRLRAAAANEWERWAIWKSNCKNRFLENFFDNITILLNYYVRYFSATSGNPAACGKQCLLTNAWRFFADLFTYTD